jgi:hypothetical protein
LTQKVFLYAQTPSSSGGTSQAATLLKSRILCGTYFHNIILPIFQSNNFNQFSAAKGGGQFPGHVVSSRGTTNKSVFKVS